MLNILKVELPSCEYLTFKKFFLSHLYNLFIFHDTVSQVQKFLLPPCPFPLPTTDFLCITMILIPFLGKSSYWRLKMQKHVLIWVFLNSPETFGDKCENLAVNYTHFSAYQIFFEIFNITVHSIHIH